VQPIPLNPGERAEWLNQQSDSSKRPSLDISKGQPI